MTLGKFTQKIPFFFMMSRYTGIVWHSWVLGIHKVFKSLVSMCLNEECFNLMKYRTYFKMNL